MSHGTISGERNPQKCKKSEQGKELRLSSSCSHSIGIAGPRFGRSMHGVARFNLDESIPKAYVAACVQLTGWIRWVHDCLGHYASISIAI